MLLLLGARMCYANMYMNLKFMELAKQICDAKVYLH